jgi:hypothetical protein
MRGLDRRNSWVAGEVSTVESQDVANRVRLHEGNKTGIVYLPSWHGMSHDELTPERVNGWKVSKE